MPTTDHPLVLDLGSVVGPQGPQGPSGVATTSGAPSPSTGSDGDVMIDPSTGIFYKKTSGAWAPSCQLALASDVMSRRGAESDLKSLLPWPSGYSGSGGFSAFDFGGIVSLQLAFPNQDASVFTKTIKIGLPNWDTPSQGATILFTVPEGIRPQKTSYYTGRVHVVGMDYRAEFTINSAWGSHPGVCYVNQIYHTDFSDADVTQVDATGFDMVALYMKAMAFVGPYDPAKSSAYAVGDYAVHDGTTYKCHTATANPPGTWDASKWTAIAPPAN